MRRLRGVAVTSPEAPQRRSSLFSMPTIIGPTPQERTNALLRDCASRIYAASILHRGNPAKVACEEAVDLVQIMRERGWLEWEASQQEAEA